MPKLAAAPVIDLHHVEGEGNAWLFWCPGCATHHAPAVARWSRAGSTTSPTLSPSVVTEYADGRRCHLFVREGKLVFLDDCTHALAGQTVPMEPIP